MNEPQSSFKILGLNLLVFVIYTIIFFALGPSDGFILAFFGACLHFVICIIVAIVQKNWIWTLSGLLILLIGLGTCVSFGQLNIR